MDAQTTPGSAPRRIIPSRRERLGLTGNTAKVSQQAIIMAKVLWPSANDGSMWYERAANAFHGATFMVKPGSADDIFLSWLSEAAEMLRTELSIKEFIAK